MPATVQSLAYTFDAAGDLKTANDNVDATRNQAFNYDALYRLTQARGLQRKSMAFFMALTEVALYPDIGIRIYQTP